MHDTTTPVAAPQKVAPDTYLTPNLAPAGPEGFVPVNSLVILGEEPIVVGAGAPVHREHWLELYSFTGVAYAEQVGSRRLHGREGFIDMQLAHDGRASVFATPG